MRLFPLLLVLVARTAMADAPGTTPTDPYATCLDQRHAIYEDASTITDFEVRGRMLATMPTCTPGMVDDGGLARATNEANALSRTARAPASEQDWRWSVTWQPFQVLKHTYLFGVEFSPMRHVAVGLHGGIGRTEHVEIGDSYHWYYTDGTDQYAVLQFTEMQIGAGASYFLHDAMEGVHVGADFTYQHFGDPTYADRVTNPWISVEGLSMAAFVGWKGVTREGLTMEIQAGPMLTGMSTDNKLMLKEGWSFDTDSVHLYSRFAGGWSF